MKYNHWYFQFCKTSKLLSLMYTFLYGYRSCPLSRQERKPRRGWHRWKQRESHECREKDPRMTIAHGRPSVQIRTLWIQRRESPLRTFASAPSIWWNYWRMHFTKTRKESKTEQDRKFRNKQSEREKQDIPRMPGGSKPCERSAQEERTWRPSEGMC